MTRSRTRPQVELLEDRRTPHAGHGFEAAAVPVGSEPPSATPVFAPVKHPLGDLPRLHSNPAAPAKLYLDFNGNHEDWWGYVTAKGLIWWGYNDVNTPVFSLDRDRTAFTDEELITIRGVWHAVAEDFAPFNVDVTTEDPGDFSDGRGLRVAVGGHWNDWLKEKAGGVAKYGSFTSRSPNVVFVFADVFFGAGSFLARSLADTVSHEAGHAFDLRHQSEWSDSGFLLDEYRGVENGVGALMGSQGGRSVWSRGLTDAVLPGPSGGWVPMYQDDMAVLAGPDNGFDYRPDDHGDTLATASSLSFDASNRELVGGGIIERHAEPYRAGDADSFRFASNGGEHTISVLPSVFARGDGQPGWYDNNLLPVVELFDEAGRLVPADDQLSGPGVTLRPDLAPGVYRIRVRSDGSTGNVGQYALSVRDHAGPTVTFSSSTVHTFGPASSTSWTGAVDVTFSEPIDPTTLTSDVVVVQKSGPVRLEVLRIEPVWGTSNRQFRIVFRTPGPGEHRVLITPAVRDVYGNALEPGTYAGYFTVVCHATGPDPRPILAAPPNLPWGPLPIVRAPIPVVQPAPRLPLVGEQPRLSAIQPTTPSTQSPSPPSRASAASTGIGNARIAAVDLVFADGMRLTRPRPRTGLGEVLGVMDFGP